MQSLTEVEKLLAQHKEVFDEGLGTVEVCQLVFDDSTERPIAIVSHTLAPAERRYSQLDKEALAIVLGLQKFNQYLFGRPFII